MNTISRLLVISSIAMLAACGSESDGYQYEDSESNDQDNIVQSVNPGIVIGRLSYGVDFDDYYYIFSDGDQLTKVSVTNHSGMDLKLSEVDIFSQTKQSVDRDLIDDSGHEVESFENWNEHGNSYSTYIKVTTTEGSGEYTLTIEVSSVADKPS